MNKFSIVLTVLIGIAAVGYSQRAPIAERLLTAALPARMGTDQVAALAAERDEKRKMFHATTDWDDDKIETETMTALPDRDFDAMMDEEDEAKDRNFLCEVRQIILGLGARAGHSCSVDGTSPKRRDGNVQKLSVHPPPETHYRAVD